MSHGERPIGSQPNDLTTVEQNWARLPASLLDAAPLPPHPSHSGWPEYLWQYGGNTSRSPPPRGRAPRTHCPPICVTLPSRPVSLQTSKRLVARRPCASLTIAHWACSLLPGATATFPRGLSRAVLIGAPPTTRRAYIRQLDSALSHQPCPAPTNRLAPRSRSSPRRPPGDTYVGTASSPPLQPPVIHHHQYYHTRTSPSGNVRRAPDLLDGTSGHFCRLDITLGPGISNSHARPLLFARIASGQCVEAADTLQTAQYRHHTGPAETSPRPRPGRSIARSHLIQSPPTPRHPAAAHIAPLATTGPPPRWRLTRPSSPNDSPRQFVRLTSPQQPLYAAPRRAAASKMKVRILAPAASFAPPPPPSPCPPSLTPAALSLCSTCPFPISKP